MKQLYFFFFIIFTAHSAMGQACGAYKIRVVGKLMKPEYVEMVKVPKIQYLESKTDLKFEDELMNVLPFQDKISIELYSPTTSHLYDDPEDLIQFYKMNHASFPIIIVTKGEERMEIKVEINWADLKVKKIEDEGIWNVFEFNFGDIWVYFDNGEVDVEITNFKNK